MHKPIKYVEKGLSYLANAAWAAFQRFNQFSRTRRSCRNGPTSRC